MRPRFSIALLSEDRSEPTWRGLRSLVEKLLRRFEDDGFTPRVELVPADPQVRPVLIANRWRSAQPRDEAEKRELWRYLARKIAEPGGFVLFHYDGDKPWSRRAESPARAQFDREVRTRVAQVLSSHRLPPDEISRKLARLIECVPFYSVEAWLYQATDHAVTLCRQKHQGAHASDLARWDQNRTSLDEIDKPKDKCCLGSDHNETLGKHVPVREVIQAGRSLTWFLWSLHASPDLEDALADFV